MALARLSVKVGKKGKASAHAKYIAREDKYAKNSADEKLEFVGCGNMPSWAEKDPNIFWQTADEFERKNGSAYREHIISLPRELTPDQRHEFLKDWIATELGDKHVYQYAIHNPTALDGKEQPHAHLMFSERTLDNIERAPDQFFKRYNSKNPEKGGAKKANTGLKASERKELLKDQRQRFEDTYNKHLKKAGLNIRVSMKSFADRNFTNLKPINFSMTEFRKGSDRVDAYKRTLELRREIPKLMQDAKTGLVAVVDEFKQLKAQRAEQERQAEIERQRAEQERQLQRQAEIERQQVEQERQAKIEQARQAEQARIESRSTADLLDIQLKITVKDKDKSYAKGTIYIQDEIPINQTYYKCLKAAERNKRQFIVEDASKHLNQNQTALNIKKFLFDGIKEDTKTNIKKLNDYHKLSIKNFVKEYDISHDLEDLKALDRLNPDPKQNAPSQPQRTLAKENNNDLDLDF